jgi:hypothetical protein
MVRAEQVNCPRENVSVPRCTSMVFRTDVLIENTFSPDSSSAQTLELSEDLHPLADLFQATPRQRQLVFALCIGLVIVTLALLPSARNPWGPVPFFFPVCQTAAIFSCLVTAYLMHGHFRATRAPTLLSVSERGLSVLCQRTAHAMLDPKGCFCRRRTSLG